MSSWTASRWSNSSEKPQLGEGWINGGFFVLEPQVLDYIESEDTHFQREPLEQLSRDGAADGIQACDVLAVHGHAS